ncbi:hypothetical protein ZHAS_00007629 [Anopheles sinensis]|uniref:Uncharacterized protein n=1 Tax=Anopheles sinensis TaxID=74873 RepID=A0A084VQ53_ANOSI|nr:hypothetical protein ZHAS_00007629 [Anopheles sinensis]
MEPIISAIAQMGECARSNPHSSPHHCTEIAHCDLTGARFFRLALLITCSGAGASRRRWLDYGCLGSAKVIDLLRSSSQSPAGAPAHTSMDA